MQRSRQTGLPHGRNPATGMRIYTDAEAEWLRAIGRCRDIRGRVDLRSAFQTAMRLGYRKVAEEQPLPSLVRGS